MSHKKKIIIITDPGTTSTLAVPEGTELIEESREYHVPEQMFERLEKLLETLDEDDG